MSLSDAKQQGWSEMLGSAPDESVALPLWRFPPAYRPAVLSERRRRNVLQSDPEPTGDPEFS